jgi:hypothetical protein
MDAQAETLPFCPGSGKGANPELPLRREAILHDADVEKVALRNQFDAVLFHHLIPLPDTHDNAFFRREQCEN